MSYDYKRIVVHFHEPLTAQYNDPIWVECSLEKILVSATFTDDISAKHALHLLLYEARRQKLTTDMIAIIYTQTYTYANPT